MTKQRAWFFLGVVLSALVLIVAISEIAGQARLAGFLGLIVATALCPYTWRIRQLSGTPIWSRFFVGVIAFIMSAAAIPSATPTTVPQGRAPQAAAAEPTVANTEATAEPQQVPDHNYQIKEGSSYGYTTVVSDDDKKAGIGAGDILMLRYLGERNGTYTLASADHPSLRMTCENPCQYVKTVVDGQVIKRTEFTDGTVIALAFEDAFSGRLQVSGRQKADDDNG
jgi:hypothetical protein